MIRDEPESELGKRLLRVAHYFAWESWRQFAREIGVGQATISKAIRERAETIDGATAVKIRERSRQLGAPVDLNWLLCGDEPSGLDPPSVSHAERIASRSRRRSVK